jgi:hypothetical protein
MLQYTVVLHVRNTGPFFVTIFHPHSEYDRHTCTFNKLSIATIEHEWPVQKFVIFRIFIQTTCRYHAMTVRRDGQNFCSIHSIMDEINQ